MEGQRSHHKDLISFRRTITDDVVITGYGRDRRPEGPTLLEHKDGKIQAFDYKDGQPDEEIENLRFD